MKKKYFRISKQANESIIFGKISVYCHANTIFFLHELAWTKFMFKNQK